MPKPTEFPWEFCSDEKLRGQPLPAAEKHRVPLAVVKGHDTLTASFPRHFGIATDTKIAINFDGKE